MAEQTIAVGARVSPDRPPNHPDWPAEGLEVPPPVLSDTGKKRAAGIAVDDVVRVAPAQAL